MGKFRSFRAVALMAGLGSTMVLAQSSQGFHPRATPADYAASQKTTAAVYAASVVPADQVKHIFAADISHSYVVLEVAYYPAASSPAVRLNPEDFVVKGAKSDFIHAADPSAVAAYIQEKNTPKPPSGRNTEVYTNAEVGYESGTDPY